ncbi:Endoribonuclease YbeY [Aquimixticola soesokkakensis]|uniref:Endoribonuclease YbeY n=1 Tax=Aquimixticola soesokkakensis TaxID=1519096 RepID=A0A1Y5TAK3_9RHOB|nr:rRNA maturation RNase YbeY [Aquimixticola soesokkakensis]SLN59345.1 Endoribonuclease YbeY [Aquimixticola soesokkakensis]
MQSFLDLSIDDDRWAAAGVETLAARAFLATLAHLGMAAEDCEVSLLACDDARIALLNTDFRDKPTPTNVLSWPAEERATPKACPPVPRPDRFGVIALGDIAIAFDTCAREAEMGGNTLEAHATHLLIHGMLHLLGYDHISDADAQIMEGTEVEILASLGLPDPYR